ncbi:proton-conducting transporter transmembrane domain-containing protein [Helicovermis profundi]|uniref:Hydrogenase 4 subunit F n=1 Tax=Helicovermis profundi TaxID=3065157 RepID=A0AAU9E1V1_9FIRM|nr:hydrogenase 4 subunit F [Clostridia bacterium S502]
MIYIYLILLACALVITSLSKKTKLVSYATIFTMASLVLLAIDIFFKLSTTSSVILLNGIIVIDGLNFIQISLISVVSFIVSLYSHKYILHEIHEKEIETSGVKIYYLLYNLFVFSMMVVASADNIILMWIGLEATTLSTAFLIGFNRHKLSLEAAWKYVIICSVGIGIGLIGIIFFLFSTGSSSSDMLSWNYLMSNFSFINPKIAKYAFGFIFVGVATKAGLAPMHTWLPDAHSESPSPISAMMSGVLLNLAMYFVIRFYLILKNVPGLINMRYMFLIFGFISLFISSFSIIRQKNYKRLLAFSSVENIGIIAIGVGVGSSLALYGALLHSIIHAFAKSYLFLISGNILNVYKTKKIENVKNIIKVMPINAVLLIIGILVITGVPPFAAFISEYSILISLISNSNYILAFIFLICLLIVFSGFVNVFIKMIFSREREIIDKKHEKSKLDRENIIPLIVLFSIIIYISLFTDSINGIINNAVRVIIGV